MIIIVSLAKNHSEFTKVFFSCVTIAALLTTTTMDQEVLVNPPLTNVSFSCVEKEPKPQSLLFQFQLMATILTCTNKAYVTKKFELITRIAELFMDFPPQNCHDVVKLSFFLFSLEKLEGLTLWDSFAW